MSLQYGSFFKYPRKVFKYFLSFIYPLVIKIYKLPKIATIEETIDEIIKEKCSICRFGDGELIYITEKRNLPFQKQDESLRQRFIQILNSNHPKILVGLPIGFQTLENLKKDIKTSWRAIVVWTYPNLKKYLEPNKYYYNSSITRLYIGFENNEDSGRLFQKFRSIWNDREIVLIEGEKSRLGTQNNLFENSSSLVRIIAPAHHAFDQYDNLYQEALKYPKTSLILVSLGPTAKPLVYDLALLGYQAIDVGNLDLEYMWYLMGAKTIVKIDGKYTSEAKGGRDVEDVFDERYNSQIKAKFIN
jgi:glycosyltransferase family protein